MKITNKTDGKIIGLGEVRVLPGETKEVPNGFEKNPILDLYVKKGIAEITVDKKSANSDADEKKAQAEAEKAKADAEKKAQEDAENLRLARLEAVKNGLNDEELGQLANELGIKPADCKDQADVLKKVKAALKK